MGCRSCAVRRSRCTAARSKGKTCEHDVRDLSTCQCVCIRDHPACRLWQRSMPRVRPQTQPQPRCRDPPTSRHLRASVSLPHALHVTCWLDMPLVSPRQPCQQPKPQRSSERRPTPIRSRSPWSSSVNPNSLQRSPVFSPRRRRVSRGRYDFVPKASCEARCRASTPVMKVDLLDDLLSPLSADEPSSLDPLDPDHEGMSTQAQKYLVDSTRSKSPTSGGGTVPEVSPMAAAQSPAAMCNVGTEICPECLRKDQRVDLLLHLLKEVKEQNVLIKQNFSRDPFVTAVGKILQLADAEPTSPMKDGLSPSSRRETHPNAIENSGQSNTGPAASCAVSDPLSNSGPEELPATDMDAKTQPAVQQIHLHDEKMR